MRKSVILNRTHRGLLDRLFVFGLILICAIEGFSQSTSLTTERISTNLDFPWEIQWGSDEHLWMTQTTGAIIRYNPKYNESHTLITLPVAVDPDHGNPAAIGLFGLAIHPDFPVVPWIYVMYNYDFIAPDSVSTRISRLTYNPVTDLLENETVFVEGYKGYDKHSGGRMIITQGRKLLVTTGDEFKRSYAQRMDKLNGKTLRFNLDGSIPEDNPFISLEAPFSYIYSLGHRNPQGIVQTTSGNIFSSEHGPNSDDEVNLIQSGKNYGWPFVKGFCDDNYPGSWNDNIAEGGESELAPYFGTDNHRADFYPYEYENETDYCNNFDITEPAHSFLNERVAPSGLTFYNSDTIPEWKNSLLLATLREKDIRVMKLNEAQDEIISVETVFNDEFDRVRDLAVTPYGDIYVISSEREDNNINSLYRISKETTGTIAAADLALSFQHTDSSLVLSWTSNADYLSYFIIERITNGDRETMDTLNHETKTFVDNSIEFGEAYSYLVKTMQKGSEVAVSEAVNFRAIDYPVDLILPNSFSLIWDETNQGILLEWTASVDTFTTFVINRSDASESFGIDTVSSTTDSFIDQSITYGVPYGYVINSVRDDKVIGKSDSVVFVSSDYPEIVDPLNISNPSNTLDLFSLNGESGLAEVSIGVYDLSGQQLLEIRKYSWEQWINVRNQIVPTETVVLWKAELTTINQKILFAQGKLLITK